MYSVANSTSSFVKYEDDPCSLPLACPSFVPYALHAPLTPYNTPQISTSITPFPSVPTTTISHPSTPIHALPHTFIYFFRNVNKTELERERERKKKERERERGERDK